MGTAIIFKGVLPLFSLLVGLLFFKSSGPVGAPPVIGEVHVHEVPLARPEGEKAEKQEVGQEDHADAAAEPEAGSE